MTLKVGDKVRHRGGTEVLTVVEVHDDDTVDVITPQGRVLRHAPVGFFEKAE